MKSSRSTSYIITLLSLAISATVSAAPKLYVEIAGVKEQGTQACKLKEKAKAALKKAFSARPEVTMTLGDPPPKGAALQKALKNKGLTGYRVVLRLTKCSHTLLPPAKGKVYKVLMVEVGVAIDAEKIPTSQMALAGQGSAQVGTEVSKIKEKEKQQLLLEALTEATKQAVGKSVDTVNKPKKTKRKRRRRKRRKRR